MQPSNHWKARADTCGALQFDLKSPNILLAEDYTAKVADVGLARFMKGNVFTQVSVIGTLQWAAPEMLRYAS